MTCFSLSSVYIECCQSPWPTLICLTWVFEPLIFVHCDFSWPSTVLVVLCLARLHLDPLIFIHRDLFDLSSWPTDLHPPWLVLTQYCSCSSSSGSATSWPIHLHPLWLVSTQHLFDLSSCYSRRDPPRFLWFFVWLGYILSHSSSSTVTCLTWVLDPLIFIHCDLSWPSTVLVVLRLARLHQQFPQPRHLHHLQRWVPARLQASSLHLRQVETRCPHTDAWT